MPASGKINRATLDWKKAPYNWTKERLKAALEMSDDQLQEMEDLIVEWCQDNAVRLDQIVANESWSNLAREWAEGPMRQQFKAHFDKLPADSPWAKRTPWGVMIYMKEKAIKKGHATPKKERRQPKSKFPDLQSPSTPSPDGTVSRSVVTDSRPPRRIKSKAITSDSNYI